MLSSKLRVLSKTKAYLIKDIKVSARLKANVNEMNKVGSACGDAFEGKIV